MEFIDLEKNLGLTFKNKDLLEQALTHRSYLNENPTFRLDHNERLEFLGDAVIELVVTEYLYNNYEEPEGDLTAFRAALVNYRTLGERASALAVNDFLHLSIGEAKDGHGRARQVILANAYEAVVGAIYLDSGYGACVKFIKNNLLPELENIIAQKLYLDPKSRLQEIIQEELEETPQYKVIHEEGPDHNKKFTVGVFAGENQLAIGEGPSKQEAQVSAAEQALQNQGWLEKK